MPTVLGSRVRMLPYLAKVAGKMFGNYPRHCNLCGFKGSFLAFGFPPRFDAYCPTCGSLERHRLFGLWLEQNKEQVGGKDVLHFAPESVIKLTVKRLAGTYRTADLHPQNADFALNIEDIALPDESVDFIICSHVLEHVDPDRALPQLKRILRPGGTLLLMFPIVEGWDDTYRNASIETPAERELHFGQYDHLQYYGRDIRKSITNVGFDLNEFTAVEPFVSKHGLSRGEKVFVCRRGNA